MKIKTIAIVVIAALLVGVVAGMALSAKLSATSVEM